MKYEAQSRYDKKNTVSYSMKLNKNTDADVIKHMDHQENKQGYLKALVIDDMIKSYRRYSK